MPRTTRKLMTAGILGFGLAIVPMTGQSFAQATGDSAGTGTTGTATTTGDPAATNTTGTGTATGTYAGTRTTETHDDGFDMGWLGLLGLAGLAGLLPKKDRTIHTTHRTEGGSGR
jgi:hypothetical protein